MPPALSIITRTYNSKDYIQRAFTCLLNQTLDWRLYEVIVIDGGSTDGTCEMLHNYRSIRFINGSKDPIHSANIGFLVAKGTYVTIFDIDDYCCNDFLKELYLGVQGFDYSYCDYYEESPSGEKKLVRLNETIFNGLAGGFLFSKKMVKNLGYWDEGLIFPEYLLLHKAQGRYTGHYIPKPLFTYVRHQGSITSDAEMVQQGLAQLYQRFGIQTRRY